MFLIAINLWLLLSFINLWISLSRGKKQHLINSHWSNHQLSLIIATYHQLSLIITTYHQRLLIQPSTLVDPTINARWSNHQRSLIQPSTLVDPTINARWSNQLSLIQSTLVDPINPSLIITSNHQRSLIQLSTLVDLKEKEPWF